VIPAVLCIIAAAIAWSKKYEPALTPMEKEVLIFSYQIPSVIYREPLVVSALYSPIRIHAVPKPDYPPVPLLEIAPPFVPERPPERPLDLKVTFILIDGAKKIAIINDIVVKEGDVIGGSRIAKIQKNKVLIIDKEVERWIRVE